jgi:large subunit ribosomal protein L31
MREGIHPEYKDALIKCVCGASFQTRSTRGDYSIEICAACHPFYTGKQKIVDTAGRVDRFRRRYATFSAQDPK